MKDYNLPLYASLDFNNDRGYRVDCAPDDSDDSDAPEGWRYAETSVEA